MTQAEFAMAHILWAAADGVLRERQLELFRRHGLDESTLATLSAHPGAYRRAIPALPSTLRRLIAGDNVTVDGRAWRVIIGHGHSPEHASLYCESLGLMISGDMMLPKISTNVSVTPFEPDGNPLGLFLDSVKRYGALPSDTLILPSHGQVFYGLHQRIQDLQDHHTERFDLVMQACNEPRAAAELLGLLFKRQLDAHQLSFAMGEAVAHLNYLMHAQQLQRLTDSAGVQRFLRAA
jgi:glyoxylase-like metal-dependent hydrolase (beta-lactamase superfamily II)